MGMPLKCFKTSKNNNKSFVYFILSKNNSICLQNKNNKNKKMLKILGLRTWVQKKKISRSLGCILNFGGKFNDLKN